MKLPRIMLAAPASGSGKTLITCGLLQLLVNRGKKPAAFKCGPDYIDPMFHRKVIGTPSKNLDTFFTKENETRYLFGKTAEQADISVLEGVMGFYDGIGGVTDGASSYELAKVTNTPVVLIVNAKGMSLSVVPFIKGFLEYRKDSHIQGVILNQTTKMTYLLLKEQIEQELGIVVLGYVPKCPELTIESRHLGLVTPDEITGLQEKLQQLAELLEETLDVEKILQLADDAEVLEWETPEIPRLEKKREQKTPRIGIARDEAFCFCYQDNLELLQEMGAELVTFSPLHDETLPSHLDGMIFYGGYPELYAKQLSQNSSMKKQIKEAVLNGMPYLAECGGFMYLQEMMEDMEGRKYPMVGVIKGQAYSTEKLGRFGYITLTAKEEGQLLQIGESMKAHEFHYFDTTNNGTAYQAKKPHGNREWDCINGTENYAAGFPHLYYYSNPKFAFRFLQKCVEWSQEG
ncbi:cobyrinate a,c-diamide synthase [Roseburia sp. 499]|uniref:cobyrinate a,c-diamide synthase n=1 Tax=Roseburia sp. 499 TaxID=1261634 RepID=UPI0009516862|nr:cobyrinate a,c-diamide synthase [Roseburia sp. 499]WVK70725.1 cobyrinate a,c-diamide synthase [Roseburia sp. 499]